MSIQTCSLALVLGVLWPTTSLAEVGITNLGLEIGFSAVFPNFGNTVQLQGHRVAFHVPEVTQGFTDLNGDGDTNDRVLHVFDAMTGTTTNLGLDSVGFRFLGFGQPHFQLQGDLLGFSVREASQGNTDLNGDGDTGDLVLHLFDAATGSITNLGLDAFPVQLDGNLVAFLVSEPRQGNTDLNGDGDTKDRVLHVFDVATGSLTNLGLDSLFFRLQGNLLAFGVREANQGTDLNGDGDTQDVVLHLFDADTGTTTNLGLNSSLSGSQLRGDILGFVVNEASQGNTDLNGDGDTGDTVVHLFNAATGVVSNLGLDGDSALLSAGLLPGNLLAFGVREANQGNIDLNGDGDTGDFVLHLFDVATGSITNLGLAGFRPVLEKNRLAFIVDEADQGNTDLNGDGDTNDSVLHVFDAVTGDLTNLGLHTSFISAFQFQGDRLAFLVSEASQGNADLNGDGDTNDARVVHLFDAATGTTTNLGLTADHSTGREIQLQGDLVVFNVFEGSQGNRDLNGDGDTRDTFMHVFDAGAEVTVNLGLAFDRSALQLQGNLAAFGVSEIAQDFKDLNGDGDFGPLADGDIVLHVADLVKAVVPALLERLIADVTALNLQQGIENGLDAKLGATLQALEDINQNNNVAAIGTLKGFIAQIEAQSGNQIPVADADALIAAAQDIIARLSGT